MTHLLTSLRNPRKEGERFFKFLIVGAVGFVVDAGMLFVCTSLLIIPDLIAQAVSFAAAVTSNFTWNRYWTYPDSRTKPIRRQLTQFFLVNLAGLGVRSLVCAGYRRDGGDVLEFPGQPLLDIQRCHLNPSLAS